MNQQKVKEIIELVVSSLGFEAEFDISERNGAIIVNAQIDEPMLLIGRHGESLEALQHVVKAMVQNNEQEFSPIVIDINGYKEKRVFSIEKSAHEAVIRVRETGQEYEFPPMNSYERRAVHLIICSHDDIESESTGTRDDRRVKIKPKSKK